MWRQYRRMLVPAQLFILTFCATLYFSIDRDWRPALAAFVVMQLGSVAAAARAAKPRPVAPAKDERLPLQNRL